VPTTLKDVYAKMDAFLYPHRALYNMMDIALAVTVVRRFGVENCWVFLIGPSGCGKSEVLMSLRDSNKTYFIDDLSGASLISGYKDDEWEKRHPDVELTPAVAERLKDKTLVMKDMTLLLGKGKEARKVFDQLRVLYDAHYFQQWGNRVKVNLIDNFFNVLGGCTDAIDRVTAQTDYLGSRFLYYRVPELDRRELKEIGRMASRQENKRDKQLALTKQVRSFLSYAKLTKPEIPDEFIDTFTDLGLMLAGLRAHSARDTAGFLAVLPVDEYPTRAAQQLASFCLGLAAVRGKARVGEEEIALARQLVLGSLPRIKLMVLKLFWRRLYPLYPKEQGPVSLGDVARELRIPETSAQHLVQELYVNKLIDKAVTPVAQGYKGTKRLWELVTEAGAGEDLLQ